MKRGEVWWARLPSPRGSRPVLLLSRDETYRKRGFATVSPLTRTVRNLPTEVTLDLSDGLSTDSVVNLDDLPTIPVAWLDRRAAALTPARMSEVRDAILFALDLT